MCGRALCFASTLPSSFGKIPLLRESPHSYSQPKEPSPPHLCVWQWRTMQVWLEDHKPHSEHSWDGHVTQAHPVRHSPGSCVRIFNRKGESLFFIGVNAGSLWSLFGAEGGLQKEKTCLRQKSTHRKTEEREREGGRGVGRGTETDTETEKEIDIKIWRNNSHIWTQLCLCDFKFSEPMNPYCLSQFILGFCLLQSEKYTN